MAELGVFASFQSFLIFYETPLINNIELVNFG